MDDVGNRLHLLLFESENFLSVDYVVNRVLDLWVSTRLRNTFRVEDMQNRVCGNFCRLRIIAYNEVVIFNPPEFVELHSVDDTPAIGKAWRHQAVAFD